MTSIFKVSFAQHDNHTKNIKKNRIRYHIRNTSPLAESVTETSLSVLFVVNVSGYVASRSFVSDDCVLLVPQVARLSSVLSPNRTVLFCWILTGSSAGLLPSELLLT